MSDDTREKLLAWIDERLEVCGKATAGPWAFDCQRGKPGSALLAQVWGPFGYSLASLDATEDPTVATANADFIALSRPLLPLVLSALRVEVALHEEMGGPDGSCNYCGEDGHGVPEDWPCPFLRRLASALLGESS
jgi:hypothetical protein